MKWTDNKGPRNYKLNVTSWISKIVAEYLRIRLFIGPTYLVVCYLTIYISTGASEVGKPNVGISASEENGKFPYSLSYTTLLYYRCWLIYNYLYLFLLALTAQVSKTPHVDIQVIFVLKSYSVNILFSSKILLKKNTYSLILQLLGLLQLFVTDSLPNKYTRTQNAVIDYRQCLLPIKTFK